MQLWPLHTPTMLFGLVPRPESTGWNTTSYDSVFSWRGPFAGWTLERYDDSYERACATSSTLSGRRKLETSICTSAICIHHRSCRIISLAKAQNHAMPLSELAGQFSTTTSSKQRTSSEKIGRPFNFFSTNIFQSVVAGLTQPGSMTALRNAICWYGLCMGI